MALPDERFEICYLLDAEARGRILPALRLRLQPCPLAGSDGRQQVQSLYFGPAPAAGSAPRRALRIRLHEAEGRVPRCIVEVKHRVGLRSLVHLAEVSLDDARALIAGAPVPAPPEARAVLEEARDLLGSGSLRPSCLVAHDRIALVGVAGEADLRVTFDSGLRWRQRDPGLRFGGQAMDGDVLPAAHSLLVVKVARSVPHWMTLLLGRAGATSRSPGKHALAIAAASHAGIDVPEDATAS